MPAVSGQSPGSGSDGGKGLIPFDQRRLCGGGQLGAPAMVESHPTGRD